jgi:hypothetical protein
VKDPPAYIVPPDTANANTVPLALGSNEVAVPVESSAAIRLRA